MFECEATITAFASSANPCEPGDTLLCVSPSGKVYLSGEEVGALPTGASVVVALSRTVFHPQVSQQYVRFACLAHALVRCLAWMQMDVTCVLLAGRRAAL